MKGRILVVERDPAGRTVMDRVLGADGFATDAVFAANEVRDALDRGAYSLAIVDELAGSGAMIDEVRSVRARWPTLPVIVTGTLLPPRVLIELLRLGVVDALPKPYVPAELREAVGRALSRATPDESRALDWAAAMSALRASALAGDLARASALLARAFAIAPLDAETVALAALVAELSGDDRTAAQRYRAALVLADDESVAPPDPREGLARIAAYGGAPIVASLPVGRVAFLVDDPAHLEGRPTEPHVVVFTAGLSNAPGALVHLREGPSGAFALSLGDERPEVLAEVVDRIRAAHLDASQATRARIDLARIEELRS